MALLEIANITMRFGGVIAVNALTMDVGENTIHGLIGPNGSGKSTAFNVIAGVCHPANGCVRYRGRDITGLKPHRIAQQGIARTFQATDLFADMTVWQNIIAAAELRAERRLPRVLLCTPEYRRRQTAVADAAENVLAMLSLSHMRNCVARDLPHRDQKAVALANALVTGADLLLLDEPAAGLTAIETRELLATLRSLRALGKTLLLVEHNMPAIMSVCDRITVLNQGIKIAEGAPAEVASDPRVIEAYLGQQKSEGEVR
jgi:ABC-type branched-subunit amino acid transport system ATPase component